MSDTSQQDTAPSFLEVCRDRGEPSVIHAIHHSLKRTGLLSEIIHRRDGRTTSVFDIGDGLVLKVFDLRDRHNERPKSKYLLKPLYERTIQSSEDDPGVLVQLQVKCSHQGVTRTHSELMRYLCFQEGNVFWDHLPAPSYPKEIKNVMLAPDETPYVIDDDAVREQLDPHYPFQDNGERTDEQYLEYRSDLLIPNYDKPDTVGAETFRKVKEEAARHDWPEDQRAYWMDRVDTALLDRFAIAIDAVQPAQRSRAV